MEKNRNFPPIGGEIQKPDDLRNYLDNYLRDNGIEAPEIKIIAHGEMPDDFRRQYEDFNDPRLDNVRIAVIPKFWKISESHADKQIILFSTEYLGREDKMKWLTHELAHCQKFLDIELKDGLSKKEAYERGMNTPAFPDITTEDNYPNNIVEEYAFAKQIEALRKAGVSQEEALAMFEDYYQDEKDLVFINRVIKKIYTAEKKSEIVIKRSAEAPEIKKNPFYDEEFWGRANSPDDIYLPDSDEALSFAVAAHEIGHLVKEGESDDARLDNFSALRTEELRAWNKGWEYLREYSGEYFADNPERFVKVRQAFDNIKMLMMQAVDLSEGMYIKKGELNKLTPDEIERIVQERREKLFSEKGVDFKNIFDEIKREKIGVKTDWDKFTATVAKAVEKILRDNKNEIF